MPSVLDSVFGIRNPLLPDTRSMFTQCSLAAASYLTLGPADWSTIASLIGADQVAVIPRPNEQGGQAILARKSNTVLVAYEGTRGNVQAWYQYVEGRGVSQLNGFDGLLFTPMLYQANLCYQALGNQLNPTDSVFWTGHSLGGALCKLVPLIRSNVIGQHGISLGFGTPVFCTPGFARERVAGQLRSFVFDVDPVPQLPVDVLGLLSEDVDRVVASQAMIDPGVRTVVPFDGGPARPQSGWQTVQSVAISALSPANGAHAAFRYLRLTAALAGVSITRGPEAFQFWCRWLTNKGLFDPPAPS
jgi:hypothetical protein